MLADQSGGGTDRAILLSRPHLVSAQAAPVFKWLSGWKNISYNSAAGAFYWSGEPQLPVDMAGRSQGPRQSKQSLSIIPIAATKRLP